MANKRISELPSATTPLSGAEEAEIVQGGINKRVPVSEFGSDGTSIPFGSTSGTNTYTIAATPTVTSYTNGMLLHVRVVNSSTGVVTFNVDSVGAKKVLDTDGTQAQDGYLKAGVDYILAYNSALDGGAGAFTVINEIQHGVMNMRGTYAASGGLYPGSGGSGPSGSIRHGDTWVVSGTDTIGSIVVRAGDVLTTLVDAPGQTASNWVVIPGYASVDLKADKSARTQGFGFSDESTPITAGTAKLTFHFPYTTTISLIWIELKTAQASGSVFTVDVNVNGSTILSTKLTIDNTEETSLTATIPAVISSASITKGDKVTVDVDQVGNGTAVGGKIWFEG